MREDGSRTPSEQQCACPPGPHKFSCDHAGRRTIHAQGWQVFSEHDSGVVTVRILSPDGDGVEATLDPDEAWAYAGDIRQAAVLAAAAQSEAIERMEGEQDD